MQRAEFDVRWHRWKPVAPIKPDHFKDFSDNVTFFLQIMLQVRGIIFEIHRS